MPRTAGVALFHQRITMALNIIGDADQPAQVLAAVKAVPGSGESGRW